MHADCIIVCTGGDFSGTFQNCQFLQTAAYAAHGAQIALHACSMETRPKGFRDPSSLPALTVTGDATLATLTACRVRVCLTAFVVDRDAALLASDCDVRTADRGVVICGAGGLAALDSCTIRGMKHETMLCGHGAVVRCGALALRHCRLENFETAVFGCEMETRIEIHEVIVTTCLQALRLERRTAAAVRNCSFNIRCRAHMLRKAEALILGKQIGDATRVLLQMECTHVQVCTYACITDRS